jgi:hypothetical protein
MILVKKILVEFYHWGFAAPGRNCVLNIDIDFFNSPYSLACGFSVPQGHALRPRRIHWPAENIIPVFKQRLHIIGYTARPKNGFTGSGYMPPHQLDFIQFVTQGGKT